MRFYELDREGRLALLKDHASLSDDEVEILRHGSGIDFRMADSMVENAVSFISYPLGIATHFTINGRDYLVPMAIEEPSVIAAASKGAKIAKVRGGFKAHADPSVMIGQVQVKDVRDAEKAVEDVMKSKDELLSIANSRSSLASRGAGARDLRCRAIDTSRGKMLIVELLVDVKDAMGANVVNTMCEAIAPRVEEVTNGRVLLRILSNYALHRLVKAEARFAREMVGDDAIEGILDAYAFAEADLYRCVTHNKGVMNGIIAVALATAQDTRAIEAGAHAYACMNGRYSPLTRWRRGSDGDLVGSIEVPLAVGIVGGLTSTHPMARLSLRILGVSSAQELACVMASVGLAQNFSALYALVREGIQAGHMRLHARKVAMLAGAEGSMIDEVARRLAREGNITVEHARRIIQAIENEGG
ncbi:MAG: hydroxymethylglutaryl-CoA reductase, degradative [Candidatus Nitrosocaldus sp.]|nr:hydroxymethylglutaryl-CoA reductase, degradative [Candidatus Nitrosocaldus sp.]MDW8274938.1 hydroxymethylglutaryl-CoA reductase, degradative [Candidatus Nitrosocaldus sp.]